MELSDDFNIPVNEFQTKINKELLESLPEEVAEQLLDFINNVEFIKRMIGPNRKRAKDLPRDEDDKIIVDLSNPHILEDMDYFRPMALHYQKHGCYTFLRPNPNPNSEYRKLFDQEIQRCRDGYVRESDGEWVTGCMYWFLNYCPIMLTKVEKGRKMASRIEDFPEVWEGIYWRFHYLDQARKAGSHAIELARRGCGKSYSLAALMSHNLILGENDKVKKRVTTILTAYQKEYLAAKDGTLSKFEPMVDFVRENTEFPRLLLRNSAQDMFWQMGYVDEYGIKKGSLNSVMGVSSKDDEGKLRGKRGYILFEEMGCFLAGTKVLMYPKGIKNIEDIKDGDLVMGKDGTPRVVSNYHSGVDNMYKITLSNGDSHIVNSKHIIHYKKLRWDKGEYEYHNKTVEEFLQIPNTDKGYYIEKATIEYPYQECLLDPYLLGLWLGDGDSTEPTVANKDPEVIEWLRANYDVTVSDLKQSSTCKSIYIKNVRKIFTSLNLLKNKHIPDNYLYNSHDVYKQLIAGLIDTDGNLSVKAHSQCFEITQRYDRLHILEGIKFMATNLGLRCTMSARISTGKKPGVLHYRLKISGDIDIIPTKILRKQASPRERRYKERRNWQDYTFKVTPYTFENYYGFEVDKDNLFVLADNTIVHNSFPNLLTIYDTVKYGVEEGDYTYGLIYLVGTAAEDASDFASAKTLLYSPEGYNIYSIPNVFDKPKQGRPTFGFFFPSYVNRKGCYNHDGVSDVVKALIQILMNRHKAKYSSDPNSVLRVIAEMPITPAEAIIKVKAAYFPITSLTERLSQIDVDPKAFDDVYVGTLTQDPKTGEVKFTSTSEEPIRKFGVDNTTKGAIEILEMPEKDKSGKVYNERYIIGLDPVNNDQAESSSLSSTFVFDLFTDRIVAEYTGRQPFVDDNFEITRLLCLFYNAKCLYESNNKGAFSYFSKMNCSHLLADTPQYLRDKQIVKYSAFGSNAHPYTEKVYTPTGLKFWKEIQVGDELFAPDGTITKVINIPTDDVLDVYEITLRDGRKVRASGDHLWQVCKGTRAEKRPVLVTTLQLKDDLLYIRKGGTKTESKYYIPNNDGVEYEEQFIPMQPYLLGLMLGDGCMSSRFKTAGKYLDFTSSIDDMKEYAGYIGCNYRTVDDRHHRIELPGWSDIVNYLKLAGTDSHTKFIPDCYKYNSREIRLEILRGLFDTDGTVFRDGGTPYYTTTSKRLAEDVLEVARSLGINGNMIETSNSYGSIYNVRLYTTTVMFKLKRKAEKQRMARCRNKYTGIVSIEYVGKEKAKCVTVDREDGLYLIGDYITTHNSKGVNASAAVNNYANNLIREWLLKPVPTTVTEDGETKVIEVPNLYFIRNRALLEELIAFTPEINVDRIRALGMVMLYREEKLILYQGNLSAESREKSNASYLGNDDFFNRNYDDRNW